MSRSKRPSELFLFTGDHLDDRVPLLPQFRVRLAHHFDRRTDQLRNDEILEPKQERVPHRTTDQPPEHVAAALIRRHHSVGDEERHRPSVIGDDPK